MSLLQTISVLLFATAITVVPSQLVSPLTAQEVNLLTQDFTKFPVVNSARLEKNMRVSWSTPVRVIDPFEGSYLAVFDKHHWSKGLLGAEGNRQVISLWSPDFVRVLFTDTTSQCTSVYDPETKQTISNCIDSDTTPQVRQLLLKIGEQVFQLDGQNNSFEVTKDLSSALTKAPDEDINIRLVLEGGESVDSRIGKRTVSAWKAVYQSPTSANRSESAPPN